MPAVTPLPPNSIIQVQIRQRLFGQRVLNVLHYRQQGQANLNVEYVDWMTALAATLSGPTGLIGTLQALQVVSVALEEIRLQPILPGRLPYVIDPQSGNGTHAGSCFYSNIAASISKRTATAGRNGVGRVQVAGLPTSVVADGVITSGAYIALANTFIVQLIKTQAVTSGAWNMDFTPIIFGDVAGITLVHPLTSANLQPTARDMRRRTVGLGE